MRVELRVFSGRRNPYWDAELLEFRAILKKLPEGEHHVPFPILGYSGFSVTDGTDDIHVYKQCVEMNSSRHLWDEDRLLEKMLLESAKGRVNEAVLRGIGDE